jgi:hypothetical protein
MTVPRVELLRDLNRSSGRVLMVEGVEQSYVDLVDPTHLEFEYMQHFALLLDIVLPPPDPVRAVHLGAGGLTMARWFTATRPGSLQTAIDFDEEVLRVASGLPGVGGCRLVLADAVTGLADVDPAAADVVLWDLYDGPRAATDALSLDALAVMARALSPDGGLLLLNVSDKVPFDVVRPVLASLRELCADVVLLAEPATLRGRRSGNCVLAGRLGRDFDVAPIERSAAAALVRARVLAGEALTGFVAAARPGTADAPLPPPDAAAGRGFL